MRTPPGLLAAAVLFGTAALAAAQSPPTTQETDRFDRLERRIEQMDAKYQEELKARDAEIARLRADVAARAATLPPTANATTTVAPGAGGAPAAGGAPTPDQIERTRQDVLRDIESNQPSPITLRTPLSFNPDIAVVTNFVGNASTDNSNPARNRFDVGSVELDLRGAVDPRADAVAILPVAREVENPLFYNKNEVGDDAGGIEGGIEVEEAYLFLHDFGVPNLTAKLGRFHLRFGRQNILHEHDWPTSDNNFVNQSFLGEESLNDSGLSLSYVIPPRLVGGHYVEAIVEIISGEGGGDPTPVLNNDAFVDGPALNTHLLWNRDVARDWNLEIGGSWLTGKHDDDNRQSANLFGTDVTLIHTDPTGGFRNQLFVFEGIYGVVDSSRADTRAAKGGYFLAQQQLNRDWYVGARFDWTQNALDDRQEVWGVSPYVTWYWSEFLRWRLEYQHKDGDVTPADTLFVQGTWIFGAHPPHPYWTMK